MPTFVRWLESNIERSVLERFGELREELEAEGSDAYVKLLPFGSISRPVEMGFMGCLGVDNTGAIQRVEKLGLLVIDKNGSLALTEHPFQILQLLKTIAKLPENACLRRIVQARFVESPGNSSLAESVFALYLGEAHYQNAVSHRAKDLFNYCEWAGVVAPFAQAFKFALGRKDLISDPILRQECELIRRKLTRTSYPDDEAEYLDVLETDRLRWESERSVLTSDRKSLPPSSRLDRILYELAYIAYLVSVAKRLKIRIIAGIWGLIKSSQVKTGLIIATRRQELHWSARLISA